MVKTYISEVFSPKQLILKHFLMLMDIILQLFRKHCSLKSLVCQAFSVTKAFLHRFCVYHMFNKC